jgi:hypothetical protein
MGMGLNIPEGMPILKNYANMFLRVAGRETGPMVVPESHFKLISDNNVPLVRSLIVADMKEMYNLEEWEILEMEAMIDSVNTIPCLLSHPGFRKLRVDYGGPLL